MNFVTSSSEDFRIHVSECSLAMSSQQRTKICYFRPKQRKGKHLICLLLEQKLKKTSDDGSSCAKRSCLQYGKRQFIMCNAMSSGIIIISPYYPSLGKQLRCKILKESGEISYAKHTYLDSSCCSLCENILEDISMRCLLLTSSLKA